MESLKEDQGEDESKQKEKELTAAVMNCN